MHYKTRRSYTLKTFQDHAHSLGDILTAIGRHSIVDGGLREYDYNISGNFKNLDSRTFPLALMTEARKLEM